MYVGEIFLSICVGHIGVCSVFVYIKCMVIMC